MSERLQKILAQAGYGSRRACEDFIVAGRVRVNGKIAELGQKADPAIDKISVDGKLIAAAEALVYIVLNKPRNVLSTLSAHLGVRLTGTCLLCTSPQRQGRTLSRFLIICL